MTAADGGPIDRIVIVGASLAGLRAAEQLRALRFGGTITVIGDEPLEPYDRPPLSKGMLTGGPSADIPFLPSAADLDIDWRFGVPAVAVDPAAREVHLASWSPSDDGLAGVRVAEGSVADDSIVRYDRLLIATGRRARPWGNPAEAALDGVVTLRTADDGRILREHLDRDPAHVVIIGAGFIGSELASSCRARGLDVTVVARGATPLDGALGETIGALAASLYEENGVTLMPSTTVSAIRGSAGQVEAVKLDNGTTLPADLVVVATGSLPNTEWLAGAGIDAMAGVAVDGALRALGDDGVPFADIFAAGDVVRWAHPLYGTRLLAIEHWGNAQEQGRHAARSMLGETEPGEPFVEVPRFWSTMFGVNVKSVGVPSLADEVVQVQGQASGRPGVFVYGHEGRCVAAVSFDAPRELASWEPIVVMGAPFPPRIAVPDWGSAPSPQVRPARLPDRRTARPQPEDGATSAALSAH